LQQQHVVQSSSQADSDKQAQQHVLQITQQMEKRMLEQKVSFDAKLRGSEGESARKFTRLMEMQNETQHIIQQYETRLVGSDARIMNSLSDGHPERVLHDVPSYNIATPTTSLVDNAIEMTPTVQFTTAADESEYVTGQQAAQAFAEPSPTRASSA
jgi:hypothetical protein